ncbi:2-hydroxyacid dehydrogenase [Streptomyces sp. ACA25]|uniref:2-hydroxyacid dehydrogenase n=1 Tax=Streptomyces sp. ACA25 TaxID=3022596 RepID=UPI0023081E52|nr:2-hydroxyacid dehydrogenase [Streptomyces sp. ACA25]MDB1088380.1 2-hydroxyacid dehydrogenase [Streptomyces sp. ACA25]
MTDGDVWLPFPLPGPEPLPPSFRYHQWDGEADFPADPARCVFYAVPYMKPAEVCLRPLPDMARLRVAQLLTAGYEHMLPGLALMPAGAVLCNAGGLHDTSTAELALALTLAALRDIPGAVRGQLEGRWAPAVRPSLADRRVLIVGYGGIGSAIEDRLVAFEPERVLRVAGSARSSPRGPVHASGKLPELLPEAEVVILCTPLTDATRGLAGKEFLARMRDGALLVNVSRGAVVDTGALLAEFETGRLRAALDVTDPEPLPAGHPLWQAPGVLITPHVGGASSAFRPRAERLLRSRLECLARGEELPHVVGTG